MNIKYKITNRIYNSKVNLTIFKRIEINWIKNSFTLITVVLEVSLEHIWDSYTWNTKKIYKFLKA